MPGFISLEGIEGSGKSTLRARLADAARELNEEVVLTREPGATNLGKTLRNILLDSANGQIDSVAELMLFASDRAQHISEIINPALARGALVICDRFIHSTLAYQGYGRGIDLETLKVLNQITTRGVAPGLVLLLDLDPETGLSRAQKRTEKATGSFNPQELMAGRSTVSTSWNRFEEEPLEFHRRVRNGFLELAKIPANNIQVIPATGDADTVAELAIEHLKRFLKK